MSRPIRVIFADDHPVVRHGLVAIVDIEDDIEVVGEAENGQEALTLTQSLQPDVVLMDLQMPVMNGVEAIKRIRADFPSTQVIILTTFVDDDYIYEGVLAGARGYLLKDAPPDQLVEAIRAASRGESLLDPGVATRILDRFSNMMSNPTPSQPADGSVPQTDDQPSPSFYELSEARKWLEPPKLTPREMDVLRLMAQGARNKQIAKTLVIAERTVKIHVGNILSKLNVDNRTEAVAVAMKMGLLRE